MYYYFFYTFYKFWDYVSVPKFLTHFKSTVSISVLEIFLFLSFIAYYSIFSKTAHNLNLKMPIVFLPLLLIFLLNYLCFIHTTKWKEYFAKFERWPRSKNNMGAFFVGIFTLLIIVNMIYSFYLMSQIDWSKYR